MMVDSYELNQISKRSLQCFIYWNQSIEPLLLGTWSLIRKMCSFQSLSVKKVKSSLLLYRKDSNTHLLSRHRDIITLLLFITVSVDLWSF